MPAVPPIAAHEVLHQDSASPRSVLRTVVIITNMPSFYRVDLFNALAQDGRCRIHVIFATAKENNRRIWEDAQDRMRFDYTILDSTSVIIPGGDIAEQRIIHHTKGVFKALRRIAPDVIIASEYNPTSLKALAYAKLRGKPYISWSDSTLHSDRFISMAQRFARHLVCRLSDAFIASSQETRAAQIHYGARAERISISLLTIDVDAFSRSLQQIPKPLNDIPVILFCGYLIPLKGVHLLLEALSTITRPFRLDIVGSGDEEPALRALAQRHGLSDRVRFVGYKNREAIVAYYRQADLFVFPSLNDAFGLVLVEALAAHLPIISSIYAGGSRDTVTEGVNGFTVDPKDTDRLRVVLEHLLVSQPTREKMGLASAQRAESFTINQSIGGFLSAIAGAGN